LLSQGIKWIVLGLFLAPVSAQAQIGYVLDVNGQWALESNSSRGLARGQSVPAKGVIRVQAPSRDNYIVLAYPDGEIIERRQCSKPTDCNRPIYLPAVLNQNKPTVLGVAFSAAMGLIFGEPDKHSVHRVRGGELFEAVVPVDENGRASLNSVFKKMYKGQFYVRLRAIPGNGKSASTSTLGPLPLQWDQAQDDLSLSGVRPGLFEISLWEPRGGDFEATGISAWILLTTASDYEQAAASFEKAIALTVDWGSQVKREIARSFLRAHLDQLANLTAKH
jgi:hypothetical protein